MFWLFLQMFVLCAAAFGSGSLLTWLSVRGRLRTEAPKLRLALPAPRHAAQEEVVVRPVMPSVAQEPLPLKGNSKTLVYHTPDSPYYKRMKGDMTFTTETEALKAGYRMWATKASVKA